MRACHLLSPELICAVLLSVAAGCSAADPPAAKSSIPPPAVQCLPGAGGFLRAKLRGAVNADLNWNDAQIRCEGGARPDGEGLRVSIAGPLPADAGASAGRTLRFVFGIQSAAGVMEGTALATNLTAIIEGGDGGAGALYATLGDDKCTTDRLQRRATLDPAGGAIVSKSLDGATQREYRVDARGFCLGPASTLDGAERLLVTTFDFAGRVTLESQ